MSPQISLLDWRNDNIQMFTIYQYENPVFSRYLFVIKRPKELENIATQTQTDQLTATTD